LQEDIRQQRFSAIITKFPNELPGKQDYYVFKEMIFDNHTTSLMTGVRIQPNFVFVPIRRDHKPNELSY
jgi:hypothetical protein